MSSAAGSDTTPGAYFGVLLRRWRAARRISQLTLALDADISTRHLSCVETGRAQPSREMVLRLAEALEIPLRERNTMLLAAGYAALYRQTSLDAPEMEAARQNSNALPGRRAGLQEVFADETADEARGSGEAQAPCE
jgi:transcriptional regulator with XRE-family HTH domain